MRGFVTLTGLSTNFGGYEDEKHGSVERFNNVLYVKHTGHTGSHVVVVFGVQRNIGNLQKKLRVRSAVFLSMGFDVV